MPSSRRRRRRRIESRSEVRDYLVLLLNSPTKTLNLVTLGLDLCIFLYDLPMLPLDCPSIALGIVFISLQLRG